MGVNFSYSHQTQYIYCSHQAGQLSNLHSLAYDQQEAAIFVLMSISGIIKLQTNSYSSKKKTSSSHPNLCQHDAKDTEDAKLRTAADSFERCLNSGL